MADESHYIPIGTYMIKTVNGKVVEFAEIERPMTEAAKKELNRYVQELRKDAQDSLRFGVEHVSIEAFNTFLIDFAKKGWEKGYQFAKSEK